MGKGNYSTLGQAIMMLVMTGWLVCASSTKAAVQVVTFLEPPAVVNFAGREIELPQFNPALGSLQSVTIDVKGTGAFVQGFDHLSGSGSHRELSSQANLRLMLQAGDGENLVTLTQFGYRGSPGYQGGLGSTGLHLDPIKAASQTTLTSDRELMQFTGCGFIDLFLSGRSGLGHDSLGGESILSGLWVAGADIKLTYIYTAVPENSTWLAAVFALLLLVLVRRSYTQNVSSAD